MNVFNSREFVILALLLMLFATLITSAQIDLTEPNIFFYASRLSPLWYLVAFLTLATIMLTNDKFIKIYASILVIYLVYGLPAYMSTNPRVNDQYPFIAEPLYVELYGHLGDVHYLLQSPGLGLYFSQLAMIAGISLKYLDGIRALSDFFAYVNPLTLALGMVAIPKLLDKSDNWIYAILLVPVLSIMYPIDTFHRQTFSLNYLPLYFYGLLKHNFTILTLASTAMVLSHPGTPLFTWIALAIALMLAHALNINKEDEYITATVIGLAILAIAWFAFHMITTQSILDSVVRAFRGFISDILEGEARLMAVEKLIIGTTREFRIVVLIPRLLMLGLYLAIFWLTALTMLWNKRSTSALKLLTLIHAGYIPQVIPFMYWGTLNIRVLLFVLCSSIPLVPLYLDALRLLALNESNAEKDIWRPISAYLTKLIRILKKVLKGLIIVAVILTPILTFSTIPFLHSSTSEILAQKLVECNYIGPSTRSPPIIVTEYPAWIFDVACGSEGTKLTEVIVDSSSTIRMLSNGEASGILIVGRLVAREAFYAPSGLLYGSGTETQREFVTRISEYSLINMNRVYDSSYEVMRDPLLDIVVLYVDTTS